MQLLFRSAALVALLVLLGLLVSACEKGSSTGPALIATPSSLKFKGVESKSVTIDWGGFNKVLVADEYITGTNKSSFSLPSGPHCEIEFSSTKTYCVETVRLNEAKAGLSAKLVLENQYGNLEIPLSS